MEDLLEIEKFIEEQTEKIKPIQTQLGLAYWDAAISGKKEHYNRYEELQLKLEEVFNNKQDFNRIKEFLKQEIEDSIIKRQLKILYNSYLGSQGDLDLIREIVKKSTEIEEKFNTFRAKVKDKELTDNEIKDILKTETDSEKLKEAWEASKKQGEVVEKQLLDLVKLRNKHARSLGFDNYYSMVLELGEQKEKEIESIFNELANLTENPFRDLKKEIDSMLVERYRISEEELKPWHYHDLFFQEGPEIYKINLDKFYSKEILDIVKKFYGSIGLPIEDILERSDLYEKPGKYQHACCMDIDREGDVRIIQNMKNNEKWMETTLHELGHGVYSKFMDRGIPYILRWPAHMFTTEAIALFFGRNSRNLSFIKRYCDINEEEIEQLKDKITKGLRLRQLVFSRWAQVMFNFERELYRDPEQDLNKLWWKLVKKYQLIDFTRDNPDWASKIHFVIAPVYYHNYLLGELLASQIHHHIVKNILDKDSLRNVDYSDNKNIGKYLKTKIFSIGRKDEWNEMIKKTTGEELTAKYFVEEFVNQ